MDKYKVRINGRAFRDLDAIYTYITFEKLSPENAKAQTDRIKEALKKLDTFPYSHQERMEGKYAGKGYHQLVIDNYLAIYKIEEENRIVRVITVQYQGQNL